MNKNGVIASDELITWILYIAIGVAVIIGIRAIFIRFA